MTEQEILERNREMGFVFVGKHKEDVIYKRLSEAGTWLYYLDCGWPDHIPVVWDTLFETDVIELILKDIKNNNS